MDMEYPTQAELDEIKKWDHADPQGLIAYVRNLWHWPEMTKLNGRKVLRFTVATGGWSGNEDIIGAMMESMFWQLWWEKSERGGRYTFIVRR